MNDKRQKYWRVVGEVENLIDKTKKNQPAHAVWDWLCADFEKDLRRLWVIIFAAFGAAGVGFWFVLAWIFGEIDWGI